MIKRRLYFLLGIISLLFSAHLLADESAQVNPFTPKQNEPCDVISGQLEDHIKQWNYKGSIAYINVADQMPVNVIWLNQKQQWLSFFDDQVPAILSPWQLQSLSSEEIVWQASLPFYCQSIITYVMKIKEQS